jgi:uncharacterized membrane protein YeaQ/YmgE (transglycosylase-associated protein family)
VVVIAYKEHDGRMEFMNTHISLLNLALWAVFGLGAGFLAQLMSYDTLKGGMSSSLVLGVMGAISGGALATFIYGIGMRGFDLTALAVALTGALSFLVVYRLLFRDSTRVV